MLKRLVLMMALFGWLVMPSVRGAEGPVGEGKAAETPHAAEAHGEAHGGEGHEASEPLLPDPSNRSDQLQALWVLIIFIVLLAILYPTAWKNILAGLKKREERIR